MKKLALGILILTVWFLPLAYADDTVTITFHVPTGQTQNMLDWYCKANPVPDNNEDGQPDMTKVAWVKQNIIQQIMPVVKRGKKLTDIETENITELTDDWIVP